MVLTKNFVERKITAHERERQHTLRKQRRSERLNNVLERWLAIDRANAKAAETGVNY